MVLKFALPNTGKRLAEALGADPDSLGTALPNTAKRLADAVGSLSVTLKSALPNTAHDLEDELDVGGGGGSYHADAVHWDSTSYLHNDALNSGNHATWSCALFYRATVYPIENNTSKAGFWATDPTGVYAGYSEVDFQGPDSGFPAHGVVYEIPQFSIANPSGQFMAGANVSGSLTADQSWHCYMISVDCTDPDNPVIHSFVDDSSFGHLHSQNRGSVIAGNGVPLWVGNIDEPMVQYDMANFLMWYGVAVDWSIEANRRKIIDALGKPVDPAEAIVAFGAPKVALIGDATAFQTNQGTGGAFTLSGSLTDASSSPSD